MPWPKARFTEGKRFLWHSTVWSFRVREPVLMFTLDQYRYNPTMSEELAKLLHLNNVELDHSHQNVRNYLSERNLEIF